MDFGQFPIGRKVGDTDSRDFLVQFIYLQMYTSLVYLEQCWPELHKRNFICRKPHEYKVKPNSSLLSHSWALYLLSAHLLTLTAGSALYFLPRKSLHPKPLVFGCMEPRGLVQALALYLPLCWCFVLQMNLRQVSVSNIQYPLEQTLLLVFLHQDGA